MRIVPTPYISKNNTLDDIDWNDPGIIADIRAVFAVLAEIEVKQAEDGSQVGRQEGEQSEENPSKRGRTKRSK